MLNKKIFNIHSSVIPFTKKELESVIMKKTIVGYVAADYSSLIETLENISTAKQIPATLNVNTIYNLSNNPINRHDVLIKVEGIQTYQEFLNNAVIDDDSNTSFMSYSTMFRGSVETLKCTMYKKHLWNYHNIDSWFQEKNIGLTTDIKNKLTQDFDYFKTLVLDTNDYETFIAACREEDLVIATKYLTKCGIELLKKYKVELNNHITNTNRREENIIINNPIILKIYMLPNVAAQCKREWPKIKFSILDKKSIDSIALWEE